MGWAGVHWETGKNERAVAEMDGAHNTGKEGDTHRKDKFLSLRLIDEMKYRDDTAGTNKAENSAFPA